MLKVNLAYDEAIVQMDFTENYTRQSLEEVQSAYWNTSVVSLHPAVACYWSGDGQVSHKSRVFISDELGHNSATVSAFIKEIVPHLQSGFHKLSIFITATTAPPLNTKIKPYFTC